MSWNRRRMVSQLVLISNKASTTAGKTWIGSVFSEEVAAPDNMPNKPIAVRGQQAVDTGGIEVFQVELMHLDNDKPWGEPREVQSGQNRLLVTFYVDR